MQEQQSAGGPGGKSDGPPTAPNPARAGGWRKRHGFKILIVDDDVATTDLLVGALPSFGHRVAVSRDGTRALLVQATFRPEVALLSLSLPNEDAWELGTRMRAAANGALRLIALAAPAQHTERLASQESGFDAHLFKPVVLGDLSRLLSRLSLPSR